MTDGDAYRILVLVGLTGVSPDVSQAKANGILAAAHVLNCEAGGILGRSVEVEVLDTAGDPNKARELLESHMTPAPDLVFGGNDSAQQVALMPTLTESRMLSISSSNTAVLDDPSRFPYTFSTMVTQASQCRALVREVVATGARRVAIVTKDDPTGDTAAPVWAAALRAMSIDSRIARVALTADDVTDTLRNLLAAKPELLLIVAATGNSTFAILRGCKEIGWQGPVIADAGTGALDLTTKVAVEDLVRLRVQYYPGSQWVDEAQRPPRLRQFLDAIRRCGPIVNARILYSAPYDAVQLVARATARAGTTSAPDVARAMERLPAADRRAVVSYPEVAFTQSRHMIDAAPEHFLFGPCRAMHDGMVRLDN